MCIGLNVYVLIFILQQLFRKIHSAYVANVCNPFYNVDSQKPITSKSFTKAIESIGMSARTLEI